MIHLQPRLFAALNVGGKDAVVGALGNALRLEFATIPMYLYALYSLDRAKNRLVVGEDQDLRSTTCEVRDVNWVSIATPSTPIEAVVRVRNRHEPAPAQITPLDATTARVTFREPQRAITPGQAAVFYSGELVLGGGWIR